MIDWEQVEHLRQDIGDDTVDEVIELFFHETQQVIDRVKARQGSPTLGDDLHFLKGSALNIGFRSFADLCATHEKAARAGALSWEELQTVFECYDSSRAVFMDRIEGRDAG
ncbi:Hpt domain-containing protein [Sulfitobacter sp. LCG007]